MFALPLYWTVVMWNVPDLRELARFLTWVSFGVSAASFYSHHYGLQKLIKKREELIDGD